VRRNEAGCWEYRTPGLGTAGKVGRRAKTDRMLGGTPGVAGVTVRGCRAIFPPAPPAGAGGAGRAVVRACPRRATAHGVAASQTAAAPWYPGRRTADQSSPPC